MIWLLHRSKLSEDTATQSMERECGPERGDRVRLDVFYEENGRVATVFWEWRHKVILLAVSTLAGMLAAFAWLYDRDLPHILWAPFLVGSVIFRICQRLEQRIAVVLRDCYRRGEKVERACASGARPLAMIGLYTTTFANRDGAPMDLGDPDRSSFTSLLRRTYLPLCVVSGVIAMALAVVANWRPEWFHPHS